MESEVSRETEIDGDATPDFETDVEEPSKGLEDDLSSVPKENEEIDDERILRLLPVQEFTKKNSSSNTSLIAHLSEVEKARAEAKNTGLKWALYGASVGATGGGIAGAGVGFFGSPAGAIAFGTGGSLLFGFLGSVVGGTLGQTKERSMNQDIDKQLIEHVHNNTWLPDEDCPDCMKCKAAFSFWKRRHHCRICGGVFCWDHCYENVPIRYLGIEKEQIQLLCVDCAREYKELRTELEKDQAENEILLQQQQQSDSTPLDTVSKESNEEEQNDRPDEEHSEEKKA